VSDTELRALAFRLAVECQGPKALTDEVLTAACEIYAFLKGGEDERGADARRRPN
jgi:hypothetical protein